MHKMGEAQLCLKRNIPVSLEMHGWNAKPISPGRMLSWLDTAKKGAQKLEGALGLFLRNFPLHLVVDWQLQGNWSSSLTSEQQAPIEIPQHSPFPWNLGEKTSRNGEVHAP